MQAYSVPATDAAEVVRTRLIAVSGSANSNSSYMVEIKNGQLVIPQQLLTEMGVSEGDVMQMTVTGSTLTIKPSKFCTPMDDAVLEQLIHEGVVIGA